jgi:hypothetical protein
MYHSWWYDFAKGYRCDQLWPSSAISESLTTTVVTFDRAWLVVESLERHLVEAYEDPVRVYEALDGLP